MTNIEHEKLIDALENQKLFPAFDAWVNSQFLMKELEIAKMALELETLKRDFELILNLSKKCM